MMPDLPNMPLSPYAALYDLLIPADDELRLIHDIVPFDFITDLLADAYCHDNGRMFKYLFLEAHSNLSDVDLVRRAPTVESRREEPSSWRRSSTTSWVTQPIPAVIT